MGLIHVLMLSRAIEAQVTVEELCDLLRQLSPDAETDERGKRCPTTGFEPSASQERRTIPRVEFR